MTATAANQALADQITAFLLTFATPDDLAKECLKRGLKGDRLDPCSCIIARLIESEFSEMWNIIIEIQPSNKTFELGYTLKSKLPPSACRFADAFDAGDYPNLDYEDEDEDEDESEDATASLAPPFILAAEAMLAKVGLASLPEPE